MNRVNDAETGSERPVETLPLERVARIAASLDLDPDLREDILAANDLTPASWEANAAAVEAAVRRELAAGNTALFVAHDRAYLARIEEERGPISPEQYAVLMRAQARGASAAALRALDLPAASELPVVRVLEARLAADPEARAAARRAR